MDGNKPFTCDIFRNGNNFCFDVIRKFFERSVEGHKTQVNAIVEMHELFEVQPHEIFISDNSFSEYSRPVGIFHAVKLHLLQISTLNIQEISKIQLFTHLHVDITN